MFRRRRDDERKREAALLAYQGEPVSAIAARFRTTEDEVQRWPLELATEARSMPIPSPAEFDTDRAHWAASLLEGEPFLSVASPEEREGSGVDVMIFFVDLAAHEFSDLVGRSVEVVRSIDGVESAWHEDRELICAQGSVEPSRIREALLLWWHDQLRAIARQA